MERRRRLKLRAEWVMHNKCIHMNLFHRGASRAPITSQSLMHLLCWKEGSAAISVFCLGNGNTGRLSIFLKVTQNTCSRTGEFQVSARSSLPPTCEQQVHLGQTFAPQVFPPACNFGLQIPGLGHTTGQPIASTTDFPGLLFSAYP